MQVNLYLGSTLITALPLQEGLTHIYNGYIESNRGPQQLKDKLGRRYKQSGKRSFKNSKGHPLGLCREYELHS